MMQNRGKKDAETMNYEEMKGKKGRDIDISSNVSGSGWDSVHISDGDVVLGNKFSGSAQQAALANPENKIKEIFAPVNQAILQSNLNPDMRARIQSWVSGLMLEALKGEQADPAQVDNGVGNLYYFCEDIYGELYTALNKPDNGLPEIFRTTVNRYRKA